MVKNIKMFPKENTDLLTEVAVAYYQDGATQEEMSKKFFYLSCKGWSYAQASPWWRHIVEWRLR